MLTEVMLRSKPMLLVFPMFRIMVLCPEDVGTREFSNRLELLLR